MGFRQLELALVLIMVGVLHLSWTHESVGLTFELDDGEKLCFYEDYKKSKSYIFVFEVIRGGDFDVGVTVTDQNGKFIYNEEEVSEDTFHFDTSWGRYTFCFNNEDYSIFTKTVYFEIRPKEHRPLAVEAGVKRPSANTALEESMEDLHIINSDLINLQTEYRLKETRGRFVADILNKGVFWWSLAQSIIIVFIGVSQAYVLKCFFTETRKSSAVPEGEEIMYAEPLTSA